MEIVLYYAPVTCSLVPYITLTEAGAEFEVRPLNMGKHQQRSAEYLKLNPKHKVPLLVVDGQTLSENVAIQIWIAHTFPQSKLLPTDPWQQLRAVSLLSWCASGIHPYLSRINAPNRVCDLPNPDESVRRLATEQLFEAFGIAEGMLAGRAYFFDHFTAPDVHFFWCLRRCFQFGLDLSEFQGCIAHYKLLESRASVRKLIAYEKAVQAEFAEAA